MGRLEEMSGEFHRGLCEERYFLDHIKPSESYNISNISVPVFNSEGEPLISIRVGGFNDQMAGLEIARIAERMKQAAAEVQLLAVEGLEGF